MAPWRTQSSSSFIYNHCTLSRRNNLPFSGLLLLTPSSLLPTQFPTTTYHAPKTPSGGRVMVGGYLTPTLGLQAAKKAVNLQLWGIVEAKANPPSPAARPLRADQGVRCHPGL